MLKRTRSFYGPDEYERRFSKKQRRTYSGKGFKGSKVTRVNNFAGKIYIPRSVNSPFPNVRTVVLRYCTNFNLDAAAGVVSKWLFRANSVYDPDYTGAGHQPYGFDQLSAIYNHYEVISSYITVTATPSSPGAVAAHEVVGIALKDDTTTESNLDTLREAKNTKWDILSAYGKLRVSNSYNRRKYFPNEFQALGSAVTTNPSEEMYFLVWSSHQRDDTEPGGLYCMATIDYRVKFWELKDLGQS